MRERQPVHPCGRCPGTGTLQVEPGLWLCLACARDYAAEWPEQEGGGDADAPPENGQDPVTDGAPTDPERHTITLAGKDTYDLGDRTDEVWSALEADNRESLRPTIYRYGTVLGRLELGATAGPSIRPFTPDRIRYLLAKRFQWLIEIQTRRGVIYIPTPPPSTICKNLLARPEYPVPRLTRIVERPVFAADGTLLTAPGYHPASQTYYAPPPGFTLQEIPEHPTAEDVKEAVALIDELISDFPRKSPAARAHTYALGLNPIIREMVDGPTPGFMIWKPAPGTGADLLAEAVMVPILGRMPRPQAEAKKEEEWDKKIFATLLTGPDAVLWDNLHNNLKSDALALALTAPSYKGRVLGVSEMREVPIKCTWIFTANNPTFSHEIGRRMISIYLNAEMEKPELRGASDFLHYPLMPWVRERQGDLFRAWVILVRAWIDAGRPRFTERTLGSYEEWAPVIGGILQVAGVSDGFLDNGDLIIEADPETTAWEEMVEKWWNGHKAELVRVETLWRLVTMFNIHLPITGFTDQEKQISLGMLLHHKKNNLIRGYFIRRVEGRHTLWRLEPKAQPPVQRQPVAVITERPRRQPVH